MNNNELQSFDKGNPKDLPKHKKPSLIDDEFETPIKDYNKICGTYKIYPELDAFATKENKKCKDFFTKNDNALEQEWILKDGRIVPVWINDPHTLHEQCLKKAVQQHNKYGMKILYIIPANAVCKKYCMKIIEPERKLKHLEYFPYGIIRFIKGGAKSKFSSRNGYFVIVFGYYDKN